MVKITQSMQEKKHSKIYGATRKLHLGLCITKELTDAQIQCAAHVSAHF